MITDKHKDRFWILAISAMILLWGSIPTWAGYRAETSELRFRGIYYDSQDYAVHIATMEAGRQGEWAYQFRFTTEPHTPAYLRLFYIVLGHVSRWFSLPSELTYHLARWLLGILALLTLYKLMRQVFLDLFWARAAFLLAALGSGLGWLQIILNWTPGPITPIDFWLIDDYVFFSLSVFPHFAFVTVGMCAALSLWLDFLRKHNWKVIAGIGLISILVQFVNPIAFATVDAGILGSALFAWWRSRKVRKEDLLALVLVALAQLPLLAYNFMILNNDPLWSQFTTQNQTLSPPPVYYFWGFALLWLPASIGGLRALRTREDALGAAMLWVIFGFALAYAPFYIQRRFLQNITIPLAILATSGLMAVFHRVTVRRPALARWRFNLVMLFVFLTAISSIQLGLSQVAYLQTRPKDLFYPAAVDHAVSWFRENATYNDFVLASEHTSQVLAQRAGMRAYMGHEMETLDYKGKRLKVKTFFQGNLAELASHPIKWVVFGPMERELGGNFQKPGNLELVYEINNLQIYRVK